VNLLKTVAGDIIKYGEVKRGYIGVKISAIDQTTANALGMSEAKGVLVQELVEGGAAAAAGVKEGDVILAVDGKEVNKQNELQSYVAAHHQGDQVTLKIFREGKTLEKKVTLRPKAGDQLAARESDEKTGESGTNQESSRTASFTALGFTVRSLSSQEKSAFKVNAGVLVSDVKPFSEASKRAIQRGDVILEADRKDVNSPGELKKIIEGRKAGESVLLRVRRQADGTAAFIAVQIPG
jgi:serine protease Do